MDYYENDNISSTTDADPDLHLEEIYEWDPTTLIDYATVIVTARRRSGKTVFCKNVIAINKKRYDEIYIFSATVDKPLNAADYAFIPPENRYTELDETKVRDILEKQDSILQFNETRPKKEHIKSHICIILDDILTDPRFRKPNNVVSELFVQGRHSMITCFCIVQTFSGREGVGPILRKNADLIVSYFQHNINDRKSMAEQFLSLQSAKHGAEYLRRITNEKYTACVIDVNNVGARKYSDYVFKYKAPNKKRSKFMIGDKQQRIRESTVIQRNPLETPNRSQTNNAAVRSPSKVKPQKGKCNYVNIRTADQIDYSRKGINCDIGYNM